MELFNNFRQFSYSEEMLLTDVTRYSVVAYRVFRFEWREEKIFYAQFQWFHLYVKDRYCQAIARRSQLSLDPHPHLHLLLLLLLLDHWQQWEHGTLAPSQLRMLPKHSSKEGVQSRLWWLA